MLYGSGIVVLLSVILAGIGFVVLHKLPKILSYTIASIIGITFIVIGRSVGFLTGLLTWCILIILLAVYYKSKKLKGNI